MKRTLSLLMTVVLLVLAVVAAVPSAFASAVDLADSAYSLATPSFKVERGAKGILVTWNADSGVDHYRVYHKTADGWSKVADNIKVGYYFDTSVVKGKSYTFTVRGLNSSDSFVTDFNRNGVSVTFTPDSDKYLLGDTDTDGMVTVMDSTHIQRKLAELKTDEYKYIDYLGDSDNDGLNITDATRIQRYIAQIPIPYPVGGKLLGLSGAPTVAPTEAPTQAPTEVVVDAPSEVKVVEGSSGKKVYEKVAKYQLKSNLNSTALTVDLSDSKTFFWKSAVEDELWISSHIEYLSDGKVRLYFAPNAYEKITSLKGALLGESGKWYVFDIPVSTLKNGSGYYDYQMPEVASQSSNPSIKVSWGKSSNADSYEVRALDAKGNAVSSVVRTGSTSATVTLNTADAGSYSVEVKAVKGNKSAMAKGTFSLNTEFITETEGSTIKVPVIFRNTRFVCNKCGREVGAKVKDHISPIDSAELREKYADSLYTYQYKPTAGRDNAWVAAWAGTPDVTLTAGYYDLGDYHYHPLSSNNPDYTINYVEDDSLERPVSMATNFSLAELEEKIRSTGNQKYIDKGTDYWLNYTTSDYHWLVEGCSSAYHSEDCISISGLQEIVIPATGYTWVGLAGSTVPEGVPVVKPTEKPVETDVNVNTPTINCKVTNGYTQYNSILSHYLTVGQIFGKHTKGEYTTIDGSERPYWGKRNTTNVSADGLSGCSFGMNYRLDYVDDVKLRITIDLDPAYIKANVKNRGELGLVFILAGEYSYSPFKYTFPEVYADGITSGTYTEEINLKDRLWDARFIIDNKAPELNLSWVATPDAYYDVKILDGDKVVKTAVVYGKDNKCTIPIDKFYNGKDSIEPEEGKVYTISVQAHKVCKGGKSATATKNFIYSKVFRKLSDGNNSCYIDKKITFK